MRQRLMSVCAALALGAILATGTSGTRGLRTGYAEGDPVLAAFVAIYGDPPEATYGRMRIPAIGVDAPMGVRTVSPEGDSPMPFGPADVAWYDFGAFPALGGAPGTGRNAVFSGHLDYAARVPYAGARYTGPGVFARLREVRVGDTVEVVSEGQTLRYGVTWTSRVDAGEARWDEYWSAAVPVESITLYTCAGQFDAASISYSERVIVRAERVIGTPRQLPQTFGDYTAGISGTNSPVILAAAQPFPVHAIWMYDEASERYLFWAPGVPAFLDTLTGRLQPAGYVILRIR